MQFKGNVSAGRIKKIEAGELALDLAETALGLLDLAQDERHVFRDHRHVLGRVGEGRGGVGAGRGVGESVEGEEIGGDDGGEHEEVHGGGAQRGAVEACRAIADFERDRAHGAGLGEGGGGGGGSLSVKWGVRQCVCV